MIEHIRKWLQEYVLGAVALFPIVWLESPDLQMLLPPEMVSRIAPFVGVYLFIKRLRDRHKVIAAKQVLADQDAQT